MKKHFFLAFLFFSQFSWANPFHEYNYFSLDGKSMTFGRFKGKTVLVVNTASQCGYTPQYKGLEALYQKYKDKGFIVVGVPSNDFGHQEPGSNAEIKKFCELKYQVSFPMIQKSKVKGENKSPLYKYLTANAPEKGEVQWNFEKFLVDTKGKVVGRYRSKVKPLSSALTQAIEKSLNEI